MDESIRRTVQAIHDCPTRAAFAITGGGSAAIAWILGVPGATRTVLDIVVPYTRGSMIDYLGWEPEQSAAPETAISLAAQAYGRARRFSRGNFPLIGLSCTAAIATDRPRRGLNRAHVAVWDGVAVTTYNLLLVKDVRDRPAEDEVVSRLLLRALAAACGVEAEIDLRLIGGDTLDVRREEVDSPLQRLLDGIVGKLTVYGPGAMVADETLRAAILPGSFNPLHQGHLRLARVAEDMLGLPVMFEISVNNVDKPPLTAQEIESRLGQFAELGERVVLTREPLYAGKAALLPGVTFVIGSDTARRLVMPEYYGGSAGRMIESLEAIRRHGCRFLVAGRLVDGRFHTLGDIPIPPAYRDLFEGIPADRFRLDLSSTALRRAGDRVP